jgi:hypothetical protein
MVVDVIDEDDDDEKSTAVQHFGKDIADMSAS